MMYLVGMVRMEDVEQIFVDRLYISVQIQEQRFWKSLKSFKEVELFWKYQLK